MIVIREDKESLERDMVTYDFAIERLKATYDDPCAALEKATEHRQAETRYAGYWISEVGRRSK